MKWCLTRGVIRSYPNKTLTGTEEKEVISKNKSRKEGKQPTASSFTAASGLNIELSDGANELDFFKEHIIGKAKC